MFKRPKAVALIGASLMLGLILETSMYGMVSAAQITARNLTLQAGVTDGGSKPSGVVNHQFNFTVPSAGNTKIGSIQFLYCTLAAGACTTPAGLSTTSATYGSNSGATFTSVVATTNGAPYL